MLGPSPSEKEERLLVATPIKKLSTLVKKGEILDLAVLCDQAWGALYDITMDIEGDHFSTPNFDGNIEVVISHELESRLDDIYQLAEEAVDACRRLEDAIKEAR